MPSAVSPKRNVDPHSSYATPKEVKSLNEPQGNFGRHPGVQFIMVEDTLLVIQPVVNGPSEKVGILAGDRIVIGVNDTAIAGVKMPMEDIMETTAAVRVGHEGEVGHPFVGVSPPTMLYFTVTRDKIPVKSITASYMIRPTIGFIRASITWVTSTSTHRNSSKR